MISLLIYNIFDGVTLHPADFSAIISLIISIILLGCSALISGSEVAFFSFTPTTLNDLEESNSKSDQRILNALKRPQNLLATILIGNNFVNVAIILLLTNFTTTILNFDNAPLVGFIFQTIIITFLLLLFGEIMPKIYATQYGKKTASFTIGFITVLGKVFKPFVKLLVSSTSIVDRRLEKKKHGRSNISMDDLSQALELTSQQTDEDTEILEGIIKFGNIQVSDIMTPRVDIVDIDIKANYKDLLAVIAESGYSRVPVYSGNRDNVRGILYSKDLLAYLDKPAGFRWQSLMRHAYFVPETKKIDDLLNEFQENKVHVALVVDEYGGTSGLITLEDILEEIVGDIADEYDEEESLYTKVDDHTFVFEAKILLNDFYKIAEIEKEDFSRITDEVETLAGLILELKGEIPIKNELIEYGKYIFEITSVDDRRIKTVKLYIKEKKDTNEQNETQ
ncbi:gliding motility-associated protein GldE [Paludibacter sp. 221]|uniref:gliding motility-associated protein GldE n=1 Tax=Paludibacter sp. 221 TaxID=2302939 RepID=UPI0019434A52|nr:gliding motility-associated protein GldE [Paludibacter sp. 221]